MSQIVFPANNMNKPKIAASLLQSESLGEVNYTWPATLIVQHGDLDFEIQSVNEMLNKKRCSLIQLDVRLKRLTKGVLTHLELEANFLTPILAAYKLSFTQKENLNKSFDALFTTCQVTIEYIHSLKLLFGNSVVTAEQGERVSLFLDEIKKRLDDEDIIYAQMTEIKGVASAV